VKKKVCKNSLKNKRKRNTIDDYDEMGFYQSNGKETQMKFYESKDYED